jgi:hypothetical protein
MIEAARHEIVKKGFALASVRDIATGFIALGRGMALMSKEGDTNRSGRIVVTFLKALIGSAPSATWAANR